MHLRPHSAGDELLGLARETVRSERNRASFPGLHRLPYDSWMRRVHLRARDVVPRARALCL